MDRGIETDESMLDRAKVIGHFNYNYTQSGPSDSDSPGMPGRDSWGNHWLCCGFCKSSQEYTWGPLGGAHAVY